MDAQKVWVNLLRPVVLYTSIIGLGLFQKFNLITYQISDQRHVEVTLELPDKELVNNSPDTFTKGQLKTTSKKR